eukprot:2960835-Alexandrium_andersonii.AAC.1
MAGAPSYQELLGGSSAPSPGGGVKGIRGPLLVRFPSSPELWACHEPSHQALLGGSSAPSPGGG